jgi:hypothetical protein
MPDNLSITHTCGYRSFSVVLVIVSGGEKVLETSQIGEIVFGTHILIFFLLVVIISLQGDIAIVDHTGRLSLIIILLLGLLLL